MHRVWVQARCGELLFTSIFISSSHLSWKIHIVLKINLSVTTKTVQQHAHYPVDWITETEALSVNICKHFSLGVNVYPTWHENMSQALQALSHFFYRAFKWLLNELAVYDCTLSYLKWAHIEYLRIGLLHVTQLLNALNCHAFFFSLCLYSYLDVAHLTQVRGAEVSPLSSSAQHQRHYSLPQRGLVHPPQDGLQCSSLLSCNPAQRDHLGRWRQYCRYTL